MIDNSSNSKTVNIFYRETQFIKRIGILPLFRLQRCFFSSSEIAKPPVITGLSAISPPQRTATGCNAPLQTRPRPECNIHHLLPKGGFFVFRVLRRVTPHPMLIIEHPAGGYADPGTRLYMYTSTHLVRMHACIIVYNHSCIA